jgi:hypothetical protein
MTLLSRDELAALPATFLPNAAKGLDLTCADDRAAARLRLATALARALLSDTLVRACRIHGIKHVRSGHQAANALAALAVPVTASIEGTH